MSKAIFLLGESKAGKSSLGNFILDSNKFEISHSIESCTTKIQKEEIKDGLTIIDTPGVYDSQNRDQQNFKDALETIKKNREDYQISLVLIVIKFQDMLFSKKTEYMIKFFCQLFPEKLAKHICIAFTNYNKDVDYDSKQYKINEFVPKVMGLISKYTGEPINHKPKVIFVESRKRDYDSRSQIKEVIELAEKLPVIKRLEYSARPSSPTTHVYHTEYIYKSPKIESPKKEELEPVDEPDNSGSIFDVLDSIGTIYSGVKYAQSRKGGNAFINYCKGSKMYDDIKNNTYNEEEWNEKFKKKDDDCSII